MVNDISVQRKLAIAACIKEYGLPKNAAIDDAFLTFKGTPASPSKTLAALILTYKREANHTELRKISDQPAALIRSLRRLGFLFRTDPSHPNEYLYKNLVGETCRTITGFEANTRAVSGRAKELLEKSVGACVSAIEIYNKPDFKYREETFSVLMVTGWELLLKAKILYDNENKLQSILEHKKVNRCGNPKTLDIVEAMNKLGEHHIAKECRANIMSLLEIRDNAVHFMNKDLLFCKKVQGFGTASLKNYMLLIQNWFNYDLGKYNFFLMPLSFYLSDASNPFPIIKPNLETKKLLQYLSAVERGYSSASSNQFSVALNVTTKFTRSSSEAALSVRYSEDPDAIRIRVSEEDELKRKYPLSYTDLIDKLRGRYKDFKLGRKFHDFKRELEDPEKHGDRFCRIRYLNPGKLQGTKMRFYSTEVFKELDKIYTKA